MAPPATRRLERVLTHGNLRLAGVPPAMGSEDFHHLVIDNEKKEYFFVNVGTAKPAHFQKAQREGKQLPYANHNPDYQVDPDAIALGAKVGAAMVLTMLAT